MRRIVAAAAALVLGSGVLGSGVAAAQDLSCSTIRLVVPYSAGGATDVAARLVAEGLNRNMKTTVVIENRPGATGNIGTAYVVKSDPDGCTLLVNAAVIATFTASFSKLNYDPIADLVPVGGIGITPTLLVTATSNKPDNLKGLLAWAKEKKDGISYATAGYGLLQHLAIEEIARRTKERFVLVPYKGGAQAVTDLVTARVDLGSFAAGSVLKQVQDGKLKALGVVAEKRSGLVPDVPTTAEQGMAGLDAGVHFMIYAPGKTPKATVDMLSQALRKVVGDPAMKDRFAAIGFDPTPISSDEAAAVMRRTAKDWIPLIERLKIRLD